MPRGARNSVTLPTIGFISDTAYDLPEDLSAEQWREAGMQIAKARGASQWWIGDWWNAGHRYGERKAIVESDEWDGPKFQTCADCAWIAEVFETSRRREVLGFSHHKEVAALSAEWRETLLDEAEHDSLSVAALRQRVKEVKTQLSQGWMPSQLERRTFVLEGGTVVASKRQGDDKLSVDRALIDWADANGSMVLIDRQSDWGNPFVLDEDGDRVTVLENYRWFLDRKPSLQKRLPELRGKVLVCWCHPLPCHGDLLCQLVSGEADGGRDR